MVCSEMVHCGETYVVLEDGKMDKGLGGCVALLYVPFLGNEELLLRLAKGACREAGVWLSTWQLYALVVAVRAATACLGRLTRG